MESGNPGHSTNWSGGRYAAVVCREEIDRYLYRKKMSETGVAGDSYFGIGILLS